ncbi:MAG: hypothetical protein JWM88_2144 [Verrucomicrobia bacterium]|nr:hypothetical protein [Verrucomicrobiota bacterium]
MRRGPTSGSPAIPKMNTSTHDEIAQRAYQIWQDYGCPNGRDEDIWFEAEQQLQQGTPEFRQRLASTSMVDRLKAETAAESIAEFHISPAISEDQAVKAALQKKQARGPKVPVKNGSRPEPTESGKPLWSTSHSA